MGQPVEHPVLAALLLAMLAWAPLPIASNRPWSWSLLTMLGAVLLLLWGMTSLTREQKRIPVLIVVAGSLILCAMAWAFVQTLPLPDGPLRGLAYPYWAEAATYGLAVTPTIGVDPYAAHVSLLRFAGYAAFFWVAFAIGRDPGTARRLVGGMIVIILAYSVYGIFMRLSGIEQILWMPKTAYTGVLTSTFINRNNFSTYANLGIVMGLALLLERMLRQSDAGWRRALLELLNEVFGKRVFLLLTVLVTLTATLLTQSRGGMLALGAAVLVLIGIIIRVGRPRLGMALISLGVISAVLMVVFYVSADQTLRRLENISSDTNLDGGGRFSVWVTSMQLIADRPWLGHGFGGFEQAFMSYSPEWINVIYDKAHNTYIEHAVELGLPATAALYAGFLILLGSCFGGLRHRRRNRVFPLIGIATTIVVGVHALVDFSIQMPAVAVTYATILGLAVAQSARSSATAEASDEAKAMPRVEAEEPAAVAVPAQ